jgi:hypothetical protein
VRNLILGGGCPMDTVLNWLYSDEVAGTVWWVLGSSLHKGIELTILNDLSFEDGLRECILESQILLHANLKVGTIESPVKNRKRDLSTMKSDMKAMFTTWWNAVHPSGADRLHWYDDYSWPPKVEYMISLPDEVKRSGAALFTEVDAIFEDGPEDRPVAIVDWKTGSSKTSDPNQLHIYRYGLHQEGGWYPEGTGPTVGWFHHLNENKIQLVDPYVGDTVVRHWLQATSDYKKAMVENNTIVANPSYLCRNFNNAQPLCPACADSPEDVKPWVEILGRLERATVREVPILEVGTQEKDNTNG